MSKRELPSFRVPTRQGVRSDISVQALQRWNSDIRAAGGGDAEASISILEPIGEDWFGGGVTAKRISAALRSIGERPVTVNINSPGGDFFEGLAIYNLLVEHKAEVTIKVMGLAASAASIIAMAGDQVQIARAAFLMIHNTWVLAAGDRNAFREVADWLEPFDAAAVDVYQARTGIEVKRLSSMLDEETWIGGSAAVDQGFADALLGDEAVAGAAQNAADLSPQAARAQIDLIMARAGLSRSESRGLVAALKSGMPSAAPASTPSAAGSGMPSAAVTELARGALAKLDSI